MFIYLTYSNLSYPAYYISCIHVYIYGYKIFDNVLVFILFFISDAAILEICNYKLYANLQDRNWGEYGGWDIPHYFFCRQICEKFISLQSFLVDSSSQSCSVNESPQYLGPIFILLWTKSSSHTAALLYEYNLFYSMWLQVLFNFHN